MGFGETLKDWLGYAGDWWGERLGGWAMDFVARGIYKGVEDMEPGAINSMRSSLLKIAANPAAPEELKDFIKKSLVAGNPFAVFGGIVTMILGSFGALLGGSVPVGNFMRYEQEKLLRSSRLDPLTVITAWRRDKDTYAPFFEDLKEQGWTDERIEALKLVTLYYPSPAELIHWTAREVFEPEMIKRYGLMEGADRLKRDLFYRAGMNDEQIDNHWIAHWEHASWMQMIEMLHRNIINEQDVKDWFPLVEMAPFWADNLIQIAYAWPTRVDVRRFWDMRAIDEDRLREIYEGMGYRGKNLDDYVLWTKVYVAFPDLMTRMKNGWLSPKDVSEELERLGMPPERVKEMMETKVKATASEKMAKEKDITMSQIIKGVKKAVISRDEGMLLLQDLGYDPYEAAYILAIEIPQDEVVTEVKIRELTKADVLAGLKAGVIYRDEARVKLLGLRYTAADVEFLLKIYDAQVKPPTEEKERQASKADIVKAVKMGLITPEDAYLMLLDIGFSPEASEFILLLIAEESPFSPMSYTEFKDLTGKWRQVVRPGEMTMPDELKQLADTLVQLTRDVESLESTIKAEKAQLISDEPLPEAATARLEELQVTLNRTRAEQQRVQHDYNAKMAEWRHKAS